MIDFFRIIKAGTEAAAVALLVMLFVDTLSITNTTHVVMISSFLYVILRSMLPW